jgi:hypothetical protein
MRFGISWLAVVALVALLYVVVNGLANPRTRPFVLGLGALVGLGFAFLWLAPSQMAPVQERAERSVATDRVAPRVVEAAPAPLPPKSSAATETRQPKVTLIAALRQAIVQAWTARGLPASAEAPPKPAAASQPDVPARPPGWVNAAPQMQDNGYRMSVRVGPFTTPLECERELPKALQGAVTEYAELSLGPEAAAVRLPDDVLRQLVRQRWTEVRPMEIGGGSQDMVSLHALVVFDVPMQQRIKAEAQRLLIGQRVRGGAMVFGGVLGLLALAWGGLKWATRRKEVERGRGRVGRA